MKIIYKNESGVLSIITPSPEALSILTIEQIAQKDVPSGLAYKIVEDTYIPEDRTFRDAWEVDAAELTDGIGADYGIGSTNVLLGYDKAGSPVVVTHNQYLELLNDQN